MLKLKEDGYCYISDIGIEYELLEGIKIGGKEKNTSDIIFIMLTDPDHNVDNNIVGYLFGASMIESDPKGYEEFIKEMVINFERRNFNNKKEIGIIHKAILLDKLVGRRFKTLDDIKNEIEKNTDLKINCIMESDSERPEDTDFMIDIEFKEFNIYTIFYLLDNDGRYYITEV